VEQHTQTIATCLLMAQPSKSMRQTKTFRWAFEQVRLRHEANITLRTRPSTKRLERDNGRTYASGCAAVFERLRLTI